MLHAHNGTTSWAFECIPRSDMYIVNVHVFCICANNCSTLNSLCRCRQSIATKLVFRINQGIYSLIHIQLYVHSIVQPWCRVSNQTLLPLLSDLFAITTSILSSNNLRFALTNWSAMSQFPRVTRYMNIVCDNSLFFLVLGPDTYCPSVLTSNQQTPWNL